jgi:putative Holliday junction resolvase
MQRLLNTQGKLLGIDFGDKRTGLAVCDKNRIIASGIGQISVGGMQRTAAHICGLIKQEGITGGIVVGLPINMDGSHGPRAEHAEKFARILGEMLAGDEGTAKLPIVMLDERMTTMVAARYLNETDTRGAKRKQVIDTLSAQIILQNALDRLKNMSQA